jgi:hypothetical protein
MYRKFDVTGNLILHSALFSASKHSHNWSKVGHGSVNVAWSRLQIILSLERALAASAAAAAAAASGRALRATVTPLPAFFATTA